MALNPIHTAPLASSIAALILVPNGSAQVVSNLDLGLTGFTIDTSSENGMYWDIDGDGHCDFVAYAYPEYISITSTYYGSSSVLILPKEIQLYGDDLSSKLVTNGAHQLLHLPEGSVIGEGQILNSSVIAVRDNAFSEASGFTSGEAGYFGFQFDYGGTLAYGWAEVIFSLNQTDPSMQITRWAFESSGSSILAGDMGTTAIPEPRTVAAGLGLLALGAAGIRRWRQSKVDAA